MYHQVKQNVMYKPTFPNTSKFPLKVDFLEGRGRGFVATKDLPHGSVILSCAPYAYIIIDEWHKVLSLFVSKYHANSTHSFNDRTSVLIAWDFCAGCLRLGHVDSVQTSSFAPPPARQHMSTSTILNFAPRWLPFDPIGRSTCLFDLLLLS